MTIALDSNVFIAFFERDQNLAFFAAAATIMRSAEIGSLDIVFSSLVLGEAVRMPKGAATGQFEQFFDSFDGTEYPADHIICRRAAEFRRIYPSLKLPDAIHLATAIVSEADTFVTADKRLLAIAKKEMACTYLTDFS